MRVRTLVAAALALLTLQAWSSDGYFFPDEWFQVVELASYKLGLTPASDLAWEFQARMRPFLQPAACAGVIAGLRAMGVEDPRVALFAIRLSGALLGAAAILLLWRALAPRLPDQRRRTWLLAAMLFTWYLPYFLVRTSSENVSGSLLAIGVAAWLLLDRRPLVGALASGLALGLAFDVRFQVAFAALGIGAWLLLVRRAGVSVAATFAAGFLAAVAFGLAVDRWGYGEWVLTPWNYLRANVIEGRADDFGRKPATFYVTALAGAHPPLSALLLVSVALFWWWRRQDLLTWATLPFFLGHTLVGHKELRFLVPLGVLAAAMPPLLLLDPGGRLAKARERSPRLARAALSTLVALDLAFVVLLLVVPVRHDLAVQHRLREVVAGRPGEPILLLAPDPFVDKNLPITFLRPQGWAPVRVGSWAEADARLREAGGAAAVVALLGDLPPADVRARWGLALAASPLPEWAARPLARPIRKTHMRAVWIPRAAVGPRLSR